MEINSPTIAGFFSSHPSNHDSTNTSKVNGKEEQKNVEHVVESMNKFLQPLNTSVQFFYHEDLNEYYVSIVDRYTNEVIKEIPPRKLLDMYAEMAKFMGLFVDKKI